MKKEKKKNLFEGHKYKAYIFKGEVYEVELNACDKKVFERFVNDIKDNDALLNLPGVKVEHTEFYEIEKVRGK